MAIITSTAERDDLGGGLFRSIVNLKPIAYLQDGAYQM